MMHVRGRWTVDAAREGRAIFDYVWGLRPLFLRWPFLAALAVVAAVAIGLVIGTGSVLGWIVLGLLGSLLLLVLVLRLVLVRSLRAGLKPGVPDGSTVGVALDDTAWTSTSPGQSHTFPWEAYDRVAVSDGYLILTAARKGTWIPHSLVYAPLAAFDADPESVVGFVTAARKRR
ncbi:hypothetical protein ASD13_17025 [Microbacterium sp. Root1433D1]|uniref:hypothetical protein n=1 Tax=Microbacterium sp. Root1433D1 TaxID=1736463 RepID=UPI0006FF1039|nr:hypothetical protein [Microbacterium sp. Root1433D1]KQY73820.1 hypothetical protein ASD13_17025 [Microbacterium sp. Root1433D1]